MLSYLDRADISAERWDACVAASTQRVIYAFSWYLDTVCKNWGAVVEKVDDRYVSVFPLPYKTIVGVRRVYQPFFTQQLGLFTTPFSKHQSLPDYLTAIPGAFRKVHIQLNPANTSLPLQGKHDFRSRPRTTYHLSLKRTYPEMEQGYSTNLRRNLKKARTQSYLVSCSEDISSLVQLFQATKGKEVPELREADYFMLQQLYTKAQGLEAVQLLEIRQEGELLAGAFFLLSPGHIIFLFGAASAQAKQTGAMGLLLDYLIQQRAGSGGLLDFEGSDLPGVARFYAGFGAKPVTYVSLTRTNLPWFFKWM
ncbi:hypothetical protein BH24BAC1_BH24BAC1_07180 [soil metagenome]